MRDRDGASAKRRRNRMEAVPVGEDRVGDARFELTEIDEDRAHVVVRHPRERRSHARLQAAEDLRRIAGPFVAPISQHVGAPDTTTVPPGAAGLLLTATTEKADNWQTCRTPRLPPDQPAAAASN